jgi:FMN phosphatase YigB (HAD superfamily)
MQVEAIFFDVGNVIVYWNSRLALDGDYPADLIDRFYRDFEFDKLNDLADSGVPWEALVESKRGQVDDIFIEMAYHYLKHIDRTLWGVVPGMPGLIQDLKTTGCPIYVLSNWTPDFWEQTSRIAPIIHQFDGYVISSEIGLIKPNPEIYRYAMNKFNLGNPAKIIFADDREVNIKSANDVGWHGYLFQDTASFRKYLIAQGLPLETE